MNHSPLAFYWGLSVPRLYLHLRKRPGPAHWYHIQVERPDILSRKLQPIPLATIPRIRPRFLVWPHTSSDPLSHPDFLAFTLSAKPLATAGLLVPSTCTNRRKVLAQHCVHVLSVLCQAQAHHGPSAPGGSSLGGSGLSVPRRVTAKFPWPCVQGPGARPVGVGSLGFHVGSGQEELSCGCQLDS